MTTTELTWQGIPTHTRKKKKNIPLLSPLEAVECKVMFQNEHTFFMANCENESSYQSYINRGFKNFSGIDKYRAKHKG